MERVNFSLRKTTRGDTFRSSRGLKPPFGPGNLEALLRSFLKLFVILTKTTKKLLSKTSKIGALRGKRDFLALFAKSGQKVCRMPGFFAKSQILQKRQNRGCQSVVLVLFYGRI